MVDFSQHFGSVSNQNINYLLLVVLQYKYHTDSFSPFVHVFAGAQSIRSVFATASGMRPWARAAVSITPSAQALLHPRSAGRLHLQQLITPQHSWSGQSGSGTAFACRPALCIGLGNYYTPTPTAACTAQPTEVTEGEPVTVTATGSNFNPKHTVNYAWTTNGGKLNATDKQSAQIDTTGVAAGSYSANATITDPKMKRGGSATCAANYTVKAKPMNPPQVSCSVNPSTVQGGSPSTITATATSPDGAQITGYSYSSSAGEISGTGTTATLDTAGAGSWTDHGNGNGNGCPQPDRHRYLHGGRRSTAATADLQQGQLHPVPGSEETVACGQHGEGHPGRRSQPSEV